MTIMPIASASGDSSNTNASNSRFSCSKVVVSCLLMFTIPAAVRIRFPLGAILMWGICSAVSCLLPLTWFPAPVSPMMSSVMLIADMTMFFGSTFGCSVTVSSTKPFSACFPILTALASAALTLAAICFICSGEYGPSCARNGEMCLMSSPLYATLYSSTSGMAVNATFLRLPCSFGRWGFKHEDTMIGIITRLHSTVS